MQQSSSEQPVISTTTGNPGGNAGTGNNGSGSQAVVHVRGDSETELDLLFSVLRNGDQKSSYRNKNLPLSFFQPPEKKPTHSREGSHDLSAYASSGAPGVFHSRSHSSPAQLPLTMSLAPPMGVQMGQHTKQGSLEMAIPDSSMNALHISQQQQQQQLPQQWNINAGKYPFNNPPNAGGVSGNGWTGGVPQKHPQQQQQQQQQQLASMDLGPLPKGWEQGMTAEGDIYYIDHHNKRTSWTDPRTWSSVPRPKLKQGLVNQGLQLTPQQQQQLLGGQQQQQQQQQQSCIMPFPTTAAAAGHLLKELEHLRKEKERLAREQEEYDRREQQLMLELRNQQLQHQLNNNNNSSNAANNNNNSQINKGLQQQQQQQQQQMLHQMANTSDFCLGGANGLLSQSGTNNGANIGLGNVNSVLMNAGNGLSLLGGGGGGGNGQGGVNSPLDISDLTQLASLDVPSMLDSDQAPMESDDLISSLNDAMSSDLMLMDMQMIDTLL